MYILSKEGVIFVISIVLAVYWLLKFFMMLRRLRIDPILSIEPVEIVAAPLISIVIAVRDEERNIEDCIRSFQGQNYANWEMIIVDDCSRDRTAEIIEEFQKDDHRVRLIRNTDRPPEDG